MNLLLATSNRGKARELIELLAPSGLQMRTLADVTDALDVEESGQSFAENAALKAVAHARHLHAWVLGDDSGLVVDALGGAPGTHSARYAGAGASDEQNRQKLLAELAGVPLARRTARFVCHLAMADPAGQVRAASEATCTGRIALAAIGEEGFGYDSLFEIVEYHRTFGQIGPAAKAVLSHRARAAQALIPRIQHLIDSGQWSETPSR